MMRPQTKHGTYAMYFRNACRCDRCCAYQNERVRRNRAERMASGALSHGMRSAYDCGCRCEQCRDARQEAYNRLDSEHYFSLVWAPADREPVEVPA